MSAARTATSRAVAIDDSDEDCEGDPEGIKMVPVTEFTPLGLPLPPVLRIDRDNVGEDSSKNNKNMNREKNKFARNSELPIIGEGCLYLLFALTFTLSLAVSRSSDFYYLQAILDDSLIGEGSSHHENVGFLHISTRGEVWEWMDTTLVPGLVSSYDASLFDREKRQAMDLDDFFVHRREVVDTSTLCTDDPQGTLRNVRFCESRQIFCDELVGNLRGTGQLESDALGCGTKLLSEFANVTMDSAMNATTLTALCPVACGVATCREISKPIEQKVGVLRGYNLVLGDLQIMQQRVKDNSCSPDNAALRKNLNRILVGVDDINPKCLGELTQSSRDEEPFGPQGVYKYDSKYHGYYEGWVTSYPVVGHKVLVRLNNESSLRKQLATLRRDFVDEATRVVFIDVGVYSANLRVWSSLRLCIEYPAVGAIKTSFRAVSNKPISLSSVEEFLGELLNVIVMLFIVGFTVSELKFYDKARREMHHLYKLYETFQLSEGGENGKRKLRRYREDNLFDPGNPASYRPWSSKQLKTAFRYSQHNTRCEHCNVFTEDFKTGGGCEHCHKPVKELYTFADVEWIEDASEEHIFPRKWVIPVADGKFVQFRAIPPSCRRFVRGWKALDLCNLFTFYLVVYVRYMGYEEGVEVTRELRSLQSFVDIFDFGATRRSENLLNALNCFLCWLRLSKYFVISARLDKLIRVLQTASSKIAYFLAMYFIYSVAFAVAGWVAFGSNVAAFATVSGAFFALFRGVVEGRLHYEKITQAQGGVGTWFYILYFLGISLVLVNMLIAIIMEAFDIVTKRAETEYIPNVGQQIATHIKRTYRQVVAAVIGFVSWVWGEVKAFCSCCPCGSDEPDSSDEEEPDAEPEADTFDEAKVVERVHQHLMLPKDLARGYVRKLIFSIERKKHPKERTGELCSHELDSVIDDIKETIKPADANAAILSRLGQINSTLQHVHAHKEKLQNAVDTSFGRNALLMAMVQQKIVDIFSSDFRDLTEPVQQALQEQRPERD